jgi:hypothetical protein
MALAMGITFITAIFTPWGYVIGFAAAIIAFAGWGWPRGEHPEDEVSPGKLRLSEGS